MALGSSDAFKTLMNAGRPAPLKPWTPPAPPAAIARPAAKPIATQWAKPAVTTMPARRAVAPAPKNWGGGSAAINQPGTIGGATGMGGGGGGGFSPPSAPMNAEVDSTFMDQRSMYANALTKYLEDADRQEKGLNLDAETAQKGIGRNKEVGLTGLSEDFASRGLANSGMFIDSRDKASDQYKKQSENVTTGLTNATGDLNFRKSKFIAENGENGTNVQAARREAYARLAAAQNLT